MRRSVYRPGLIILGSICIVLTPLAVAEVVPKWVTIAALAAVVGWIVIHVTSDKSGSTTAHDPRREAID